MPKVNPPFVSIIIRTKNEERWIGSCLEAVHKQTCSNFEVILVDNCSKDQTVSKAQRYPIHVITIDDFLPGKALNLGINAANGEYIVCLSGHCIPKDENWLERLISPLVDHSIAGVYGRQEPLSFSSDVDKRDLLMVFGLDQKIQRKDPFFHNANSALRRETWEKYPFSEVATNIEDRLCGASVIADGFTLYYEPSASVYHWHGIHHEQNPTRARKIVKILEANEHLEFPSYTDIHTNPKVLSVIPVRGNSLEINGVSLLELAIRSSKGTRMITDCIVSADTDETLATAKKICPNTTLVRRPSSLSGDYVDISDVLRYTLQEYEQSHNTPDAIVLLEEIYPFRINRHIDDIVSMLLSSNLDSVVPSFQERRGLWIKECESVTCLIDGMIPKQLREKKGFVSMIGYGYATRPGLVRDRKGLGTNVGLYEIEDSMATVSVCDNSPNEMINLLLQNLK